MKQWIRTLLLRLAAYLKPPPAAPTVDNDSKLFRELSRFVTDRSAYDDLDRRNYVERCHELAEATQMHGSGPWGIGGSSTGLPAGVSMRESATLTGAVGSTGDLELALQNAEWRKEVNLSWLEFSRWGIQQIILISRLYYIKNPIIRRLINVDACYVFGRGVEISSDDEPLNEAIKQFLALNQSELGQVALSGHQKRTNYDGNLFFVFFPDTLNTGAVKVRSIDATEIQDIVTNPEDVQEEWLFRRQWSCRDFDMSTGQTRTSTKQCWYPAVGYNPEAKPATINGITVEWKSPVMHAKYGSVGKWLFGCPRIYPALDWAKAARRYLEACGTLAQSFAQIAMTITTKGGQQALAGVKQQLGTTISPNSNIWDGNPTAVNASIFASGPGTELAAFHSRAQGLDPAEVKEFKTMAAICMDVPPTFVGDLETANLATATTLDRPTELAFMHKQEEWRELLAKIVMYAMSVQVRAPSGKLREALGNRNLDLGKVRITEAPRKKLESGAFVYMTEAERKAAGKDKAATDIEVRVTFPAIREGDIPQLVTALTQAMTLGTQSVCGFDEREGVRKLMQYFAVENVDELIEQMYPDTGADAYDPLRTGEEPEPTPDPNDPNAPKPDPNADPLKPKEARARLAEIAKRLGKLAA